MSLSRLASCIVSRGLDRSCVEHTPQRHDVCRCNSPPRAARRPCMHACLNDCLVQFSAIVDSPIGSNAKDLGGCCK